MKWFGIIVAALGAWFLNEVWYDSVPRLIVWLIVAGGLGIFFEGLKREIIEGLRQKNKENKGS